MSQKILRRYLAVRYTGGNKTCTTGEPNAKTGRMSIAIIDKAFQSRNARDEWAAGGYLRQAVTKAQLRKLKAGMSAEEFNDHYFYLTCWEN